MLIPFLGQWLPFMLFAFACSISPGPTNLLLFSHGARAGWWSAQPLVLGACISAAAVVWLVGLGFGELLARAPMLQLALQAFGVAWLSLLAWRIFRAPAAELEADDGARLGLLGVIGLQWVNPKNWTMALAVIGVYAGHGAQREQRLAILALLFCLVALPCLSAWAGLGSGSQRLLQPQQLRRLNQGLALLLLGSVWLGALR
ncbi:MAG: hypothetical protein GAK43_00887 [Stenotrophomonas maltophilia]|nr:MAG: hypothetical protein GAK43_00887 [Stenotrophomonas maltophilia]